MNHRLLAVGVLVLAFSQLPFLDAGVSNSDPAWCSSFCSAKEKHAIVLYYTSYCPYSQKVLRYLQQIHKQLPMKNLENDPQAKAELKRIGGEMQVPCLIIDGKPLYESNAIIEWLSQHQDELEPAS